MSDLLNEFDLFPMGRHDDIVDSASQGFNLLSGGLSDPERFLGIIAKKRRW